MITFATTDDEIKDCYDVMSQLRPRIKAEDFVPRVRRQMERFGYRLVYLSDEGEVKAVAGIRMSEWLHGGEYLEIDDLVSKDGERSKGHGGKLFDWIVDFAKTENCDHVRLLSGVQRFDAHRFYLNKKLKMDCHHLAMSLKDRKSS